jgi:hypothetical protein
MPKKSLKLNPKEIEMVYNSIEDFIQMNHKLCFIKDITETTGLPKSKCEKILNFLKKKERIKIIFKAQSQPTIYLPTYMFEGILQLQRKPSWLKNYNFLEKKNQLREIEKLREEINKYEIIERLLYGTGKPLEQSVAFSLNLIGFEDVELHDNEDDRDISFKHEEKNYLLEVQGTTKQGDKRKINQLRGWKETSVIRGFDIENTKGIFVVNHYRNFDPDKRKDPLTDHAKKFLKLYHFKYFTTFFLFKIVKNFINNNISLQNAIKQILEGEKIE